MIKEFVGKNLNIRANKLTRNKITATTIALFLVLTIAVPLVALPGANAHTPPWINPTWTYVAVQINPTGINQPVLLVFWTNLIIPTAAGTFGDRYTFFLDVTKPDNSKETLGPFTSDPVGGSWTLYTPTQLGKYSVTARNPGIAKLTGIPGSETNVNVNDTVLPSTSVPVVFTVQQEKVQSYPETPLPTGYWTRPINSANREWGVIAGNWLGGSAQNNGPTSLFAWGTGPESAHIMWSIPSWAGGIMDAKYGDTGYDTIQYEGNLGLSPPIILNGVLYYNVRSNPRFGWYAIDLYSGETLYFHNTTGSYTGGGQNIYPAQGSGFDAHGAITGESLAYGQILSIELPNQHGGFPYLWSTTVSGQANTWRMFDAFTGNSICDIANVSATGTQFIDDMGSICYANIVNLGTTAAPNYYLQVWNTTEAIWFRTAYGSFAPRSPTYNYTVSSSGAAPTNTYWMWRPYPNVTFDGRNGFSVNVSISSILGPRNSVVNQTGTIRAVRAGEFVIVGTAGSNNEDGVVKGYLRAYSLKAPSWGQVLWETSFTPPSSAGNLTVSMGAVDPEDGIFLFQETKTLTRWGFSQATGQQLWKGEPELAFNYYGMSNNIYEGKLLTYGYSGQIRALNITTGKIVWTYNATTVGDESPYGGNYPTGIGVVADGKLYLTSGEHSFTQPLYRGPNLRCIDADTGKEIWKIQFRGGGMSPATTYIYVADGSLVGLNSDDAQIYSFGKGPSATTVSTLQTVSSLGSNIMLTGTVTDQSPSGRHNINGGLDFILKGTPAISDDNMTAWMEYMFMQREIPADAKGVPVHLTATDPNGNTQELGIATSDIAGNYGTSWTPPVEGTYQIKATFEGSKSYGSSFATTYITVGPKTVTPAVITPTPTETTAPTPTPVQTASPSATTAPQPTSGAPTTTYIAIGAAVIIVVAAAAALVLRRRK